MSAALSYLAQDERIAMVLMAIEAVDVNTIHAAPMVVIEAGQPPRPLIGLHVGPMHFRLSIDDVRTTATAIRCDAGAYAEAEALAAGLDVAAGMADLLELQQRMRDLQSTAWWVAQ